MRHQVDGRKFGRNTSHRLAMFRNMANSVIEKEQIITTVQKAKEVRRVVDRLITLGKKGNLASKRLAFSRTRSDFVVAKLFSTLAVRYKDRAGGYTRVLKVEDRRWGDAAEMAMLELVDHPAIDRKKKPKAKSAEDDQKQTEIQKSASKDPFNQFRRLFNPKSKIKGGEHGSQSAFARGGAARKTPAAGGGGNKSGGSST
jgi:large subunit ribosomal protein L17